MVREVHSSCFEPSMLQFLYLGDGSELRCQPLWAGCPYIYICLFNYTYVYLCIYLLFDSYIYIYTGLYIHIHGYLYTYTCTYIYIIYVHMHNADVYTRTWTRYDRSSTSTPRWRGT